MPQFLLKSGLLLITAAGIFIAIGFFIFVFCSLILLAPGLLLYKAGLKSMLDKMTMHGSANSAENPQMIDVTPDDANWDIANKGKAIFKSGIRKFRNFLNKYAD